MMKFLLPLLLLSVLTAAAPTGLYTPPLLHTRQEATLCGETDFYSRDGYRVNNNLWGIESATSGSQCTYVDSISSTGVVWHTTWTWEGSEGSVKSYAYSGREVEDGHTIASIESMPTAVSWSYNTSDVRANVAYDFFTSTNAKHADSGGDYELMIWLGRFGDAQPIGNSGGFVEVTVDGQTWDLYTGVNGRMDVYSFVAKSNMESYSGDAKAFFKYLEENKDFNAEEQYLIVYQLGTEAFYGGPAKFEVSSFTAEYS